MNVEGAFLYLISAFIVRSSHKTSDSIEEFGLGKAASFIRKAPLSDEGNPQFMQPFSPTPSVSPLSPNSEFGDITRVSMNEALRKPFRIITVLAVAVLTLAIVFFIGPSVIHAAYRATTSAATIQSQRAEYQRLAEAELGLSGADMTASQNVRYKLFLWFHARGLNIDEGDEDHPLWHPWTELIRYWQS